MATFDVKEIHRVMKGCCVKEQRAAVHIKLIWIASSFEHDEQYISQASEQRLSWVSALQAMLVFAVEIWRVSASATGSV